METAKSLIVNSCLTSVAATAGSMALTGAGATLGSFIMTGPIAVVGVAVDTLVGVVFSAITKKCKLQENNKRKLLFYMLTKIITVVTVVGGAFLMGASPLIPIAIVTTIIMKDILNIPIYKIRCAIINHKEKKLFNDPKTTNEREQIATNVNAISVDIAKKMEKFKIPITQIARLRLKVKNSEVSYLYSFNFSSSIQQTVIRESVNCNLHNESEEKIKLYNLNMFFDALIEDKIDKINKEGKYAKN